MTNQDDLQALLGRYLAGQATPDEARQVAEWSAAQEQLEPALRLTQLEQVRLKGQLWQRIAAQTVAAPRRAEPGRTAWYRWAAAAAVAVGLSLGGLYVYQHPETLPVAVSDNWQTHRNTTTRDLTLRLPDGSTVYLAPASQLSYPRRFAADHREVRLTGEAFFKVQPDPAYPFQVYTRQVTTTVLGTSFRVIARPDRPREATVQVRTGRVRVVASQADAATAAALGVEVLPNQQAVYSAEDAQHPLYRELVAEPLLLHHQPFVFPNRPVAEVLAALQQAYGVPIQYDAAQLAHCTVNLTLDQPGLHDKLKVLCSVLDASYQQADGTILFRSPSCQRLN